MTLNIVSKNGKTIRLTDERWAHITEEHSEMAGFRTEVLETVENPDRILKGNEGEMLAVREIESGKFLVVPFREFEKGGFIITAFLTSRQSSLNRRTQLWLA